MDHEKMFSVESILQQLKPEQIVLHVAEAEEAQWTTVDLGVQSQDSLSWATTSSSSPNSPSSPNSSSASSPDTPHLGLLLLRHGTSVKKIHSYFSQLEFRKCCLHLAGRRSTAQSMRVVHESSSATLDDGSAKKTKGAPTFVTHLEDKELRAFKHAYLCAAYPVLAAPDPPSPFSPSPSSPQRATEAPKSPYSLHDSGMEEAEDLAFIPSESICSHLQRAFQLTDDKFRDYRHLINKSYVKKSAQKLLAEELSGQLSVLENNCHPFYRPHDFLPPLGYELWRKAEYSHITELLGKFWHFSLPFPRHTQDLMAELHTVHDDYRLLLAKLLTYERNFHRQAEEDGGMLASLLSTASIRLLKEFGLRYGVGEQYRRILYLDQITQDFSPSLSYLRHLLSILNAIADLLPPNRRALAMVKKEYDLLLSSLLRLGAQVAKALEQMKSLFPNNKPVGAVELLIGLLQRVRDLRLYLQTNSLPPLPSLAAALTEIIQGMFFQTYERCKTVIRMELRHSRDIHVCPRMLNALIMEIRQEVQDYRMNFETVFRPYFDISVLATRAFYSLLMKDADTLCQEEILKDSAIDLRMLALVHRLNQLDQDWSAYIKAKEQTWRLSFQSHIAQWGVALQLHIQDLVLETIAGDAFVTQQLQLSSECSPPLSSSSSCSPHTARSVSLTPSINSAFSTLGPTSRHNSSSDSHSSSNNRDHPTISTPTPTSTPSNKPPHPHSSSLGKDFLSFADKRRHCTSVPVLSDRPAIVRVVSEVKMAASTSNRGLQAASAVEDLRTTGDEKTAFKKLKEAAEKDAPAERTSQQSSNRSEEDDNAEEDDKADAPRDEEEPYLLDSRSLGHDTDAGRDSDMDEDSDSDSEDETFTFPPLADVTDMDVSDASFSYKEASLSAHRPSEVKKKNTSNSNSGATKKASITKTGASVLTDNGKNIVWKERGLEGKRRGSETLVVGQGQRGRMSCPPPVQRQSSSGSASGNTSNSLHPGQAPSQRKPSVVSIGGASVVTESEQPFLQSIQSTVSFPTPHHLGRQVVIPVSGSAIDLLVLLQRTLGFGRSLCQAVYPPHFRARWSREGVSGAGGVEDLPGSMGEVAVLRAGLQTAQNNAHLSIVKALCQGIGVYADNMLCLDLCAVPKDIAKRVIGLSLVEHVLQQQHQNKIWGCRHQLQGLNTCFAFHNRKATYLSDRYEPITQKMCVRINNVVACQRYLDWCEKQTQAAHLHCAACVSSGPDDRSSMRTTTTTTTSTLKGHTTLHPPAASAATYPIGTSSSSSSSSITHADCGDGRGLKQYCVEQTSTHLMSVWTALCRLLAFRINLFLHDGLTLLLTLKAPEVPIATCLTPLTTFLRSHLDALSSWLYRHSFRRVIEFLWIYIVQDIEEEAGKLLVERGRRLSPHLLLQTLMHLMKFMNNSEKGITRELLLSQADNVVTKLQLFTLSTLHLIALYLRLRERYAEGDLMTQEDVPKSTIPTTALHQLRRDLQTRRKCFSGAQLTHWIVRHADLFLSPDELSLCGGVVDIGTEGATVIAQHMLDTQVIVDVEARNNVCSRMSSVALEHEYPEVSLLDQLHGSPIGANDRDDSGDTSTPTPMPPAVSRSGEDAEHSHRFATSSSTTPQCTQTVNASVEDIPPQPSCADVATGACLTQPSDSDTAMKDPVPQVSDTKDPVPQASDTKDPVPQASDTDTKGPVPQISDIKDPVPEVSDIKDPVPQISDSDTKDPVPHVSDIDIKGPVPQTSDTDTQDPVPQASDTQDPVPQATDSKDPVPQASDTKEPVPQATDTKDPVPQASDIKDPVPQASDTDTKDPVPQISDIKDPVPQVSDIKDPVPHVSDIDIKGPVPQTSDTDTQDPVPQATDSKDPVPQASDTKEPVPQATDTKDPVPQTSDTDTQDPVPQASDTQDPVPQATDSKDPVPQASDTKEPVPQATDTKDPVPQASDIKDPVPQASDTKDPVPQSSDTQDPVPQSSDTQDPVPQVSDTKDPVPQASDTKDPVPQASDTDTKDPVPQISDIKDPVPQVSDIKDPVPHVSDIDIKGPVPQTSDTDTQDPVPQATDSKDPVPQASDTKEPVPQATDTKDPVPQASDIKDPVPQASDTKDPVPQASDIKDPVPQASDTDTKDHVPQTSDTKDPVPQDTDTKDPVPQNTDTKDPVPQVSDTVTTGSVQQNTLPGTSESTGSQTGTAQTEGDFQPSSSHSHNQVTGENPSELRDCEPEQLLSEMKGGQTLVTADHDQTTERTAETSSKPGGRSVSSEHIDQQCLTSVPTGVEQEAVSPDVKKEMEKVGFVDVKEVCSGTSSRRVEVTTGMVLQTDSEVAMITCMPDLHSKPTGEICTITGDAAVTAKPPRSGGASELEDSGVAEEGQDVPSGTPGSSEQGSQEAEAPASSSTHSILTRLSAQLPEMPSYSQTALQAPRDGSVYDLDMNSICGTPLSLGSTFASTTSLFNSRGDKFYFLPSSPTFPHPTVSPQDHHHGTTLLTPLERSLEQLKNSEETSGLVEKCFLLKITPTSLLMVLYSRRRTDTLARSFLEQLPPAVQEQLSSGIEMHSAGCSVL